MRAEAPEPSIRGSYINPSKEWITRTYGAECFAHGLSALPEHQRVAFESEIVSIAWYPLEQWVAILDAVRDYVFANTGEDGATFDRRHMLGSISSTMESVFRVAFALFVPTTVIARVTPYFKKVYSHGIYEVVSNESGRCVLRFSDAPLAMLPELERSFPLAATWMLETAGQVVTSRRLIPKRRGRYFTIDLELTYERKNKQAKRRSA